MSKKRKCECWKRIFRAGEAPGYFGVNRNLFNSDFRPHLTELPMSSQAIGFDRYEMDELIDKILAAKGRPARPYEPGESSWAERTRRVSSIDRAYGTSTNGSKGSEFAKVLEQLASQKQR